MKWFLQEFNIEMIRISKGFSNNLRDTENGFPND
jgi:hypothetical protein